MKKFVYVFKSSDPAFLGWEWELTDLMYDWLKPTFSATKPGTDHVVNVINPKPEGWPAHEKRFDWDYSRMSLEDLSVIIYTMDAYSLRRDVLPHDVAQDVLSCLGRIYQEQVDQRDKLEAVVNHLRESVKGIDLPNPVSDLLSAFRLGGLSGNKTAQAVNALALETITIQREVDRLASVPVLTGAVTGALASLKDLGYDDPDSPASKAMLSAERAVSALSASKVVTDAVKLTGVDAALKAQIDSNPWIAEFKNAEASVKERVDATIKAALDANPALKALVNQDATTFNTAIQAMMDANPGLQDIINQGAPAFDASAFARFDQCPHCGREL